uniref:Major facilitator superfamily (MFS) profile domain-containing protein n=2 Tax=Lutzomyia longipalpis TaxID=7200 RepID=A0A1B0CDS1_LUTLO
MTYLRGSLEKGNSVRGVNQKVPDAKMESKVTKESLPDAAATPRTVYVVFFSLLLDLLAFTMILPLLPSLLEYYRQHDTEGLYHRLSESIKFFQVAVGAPERYSSVLFGGFLGSMFSFLQFVASPIVGASVGCLRQEEDHDNLHDRCECLATEVYDIGIALSYLLWAVSSNFAIFVIARFVGGLSKGNISLAMAIITDVSNSKSRGKGMALVGIAFSLGFIVGPMIGAIFSRYSDKSTPDWFWVPAAFAMCLALADILFLAICLQETLPKKKRAKKVLISLSRALEYINPACLFKFDAVKNLSTKDLESLKRLGFIYFIYLFIYSGLEFTVTFLMYHKFSFTSIDQAKVFLTTGVHDTEGLYHRLSESIKFFQVAVGAPERYSSVLFGGFLGSMFSFLQFVASPIVGALSDVYGRKRIMIICMIGIALSYLLWAVSSNFAIFVIARFVGGLSKGNISLAMAIITDVSNSKSRGKGMALVGIAFSLGFI